MIPNHENEQIQRDLDELPDKVAHQKEVWRTAREDSRQYEALLRIRLKAESKVNGGGLTVADLKALVDSNSEVHRLRIEEIKAEAEYVRLYEGLLSAKKSASLRTAY